MSPTLPTTPSNVSLVCFMKQLFICRPFKLTTWLSHSAFYRVTDLYSSGDNSFFVELIPRLQIGYHPPKIPMAFSVDLPATGRQVPMDISLNQSKDICQLYHISPNYMASTFDFKIPESAQIQREPQPNSHILAFRITAENVDTAFRLSNDQVQDFRSTHFCGNTSVLSALVRGLAGGISL